VRITSPFITVEVENHTGAALVKMDLAIKAGDLQYIASVPRLEANDKRVMQFNEFRGSRDGATMNPNLVRPKAVVVTASDVAGKKFEVTVPWKQ
jgi:hypothetical protein